MMIHMNKVQIIAEVKTQSPFGYQTQDTWEERFEIAQKHGDILSIHTDSRWGGSYDLIQRAKQMTNKPILAKGIHASDDDIVRAIEAGADYVLVVGRIPAVHVDKCILEPNSLEELHAIPNSFKKVVWNARDLETGAAKTETFAEARDIWKEWLCQASFISDMSDVESGADAVLVGEKLPEFVSTL